MARLILASGGTVSYVPIDATVESALQHMVDLMASSGGFPASFKVSPLFSAAQASRYDAILKEASGNG